jgi:hypothetical protein
MQISTISRSYSKNASTSPSPNLQVAETVATKNEQVETVDINSQTADLRGKNADLANLNKPNPSWQRFGKALLVEPNKPKATLAVIDTYGLEHDGSPAHGEITSKLALQTAHKGEQELLRIDNSRSELPEVPDPKSKNFGRQLDRFIGEAYAGFTQETTAELREIAKNHPTVKTVSHSQVTSAPTLTQALWNLGAQDPELAKATMKELGLSQSTQWLSKETLAALAGRVEQSLDSSKQVSTALDGLRNQVQSMKDVNYFAAAGNSGEFQDILKQSGYTFKDKWSATAQYQAPGSLIVGSAKAGPKGAIGENYSQKSSVDLAGDGTVAVKLDGKQVCANTNNGNCEPYMGTSFATPRLAGTNARDPLAFQKLMNQALPPMAGVRNLGIGLVPHQ